MRLSENKLRRMVKEELQNFLKEAPMGPQHDFRASPEDRAQTFLNRIKEEMDLGFDDYSVTLDPVDRASGTYMVVVEIHESELPTTTRHGNKLTADDITSRLRSIAQKSEDVQNAKGVDYYEPERYEYYGWEIPFVA